MKFARDRRLWIDWLFEARKRYKVSVLNYMVTSNHIHLLVLDDGDRDTIPRSIQLVAGRTAQDYNVRKRRTGAFWEDRYHATAVETDEHLVHCMVYIDLNMVRAGVVKHPEEYPFCGYNEVQSPRKRYRIIDYEKLATLLQMRDIWHVRESSKRWVEEALAAKNWSRDNRWTESIAVGGKAFVDATKKRLGIRAIGRKIVGTKETYQLREPAALYMHNSQPENSLLRLGNSYLWDDIR